MKMMYNGTQIKSLNIKHYEVDTNSATVQPSDLQAGVTCFGRGKKITGTGKSFEFASYGGIKTNLAQYIPTGINVIEIASTNNPVQLNVILNEMKNMDFTVSQNVANVIVDGTSYPLTVQVTNNLLTIFCDKTITLQAFYGKDNYA